MSTEDLAKRLEIIADWEIGDLTGKDDTNLRAAAAELRRLAEQVRVLREALRKADNFITNGIDYGYIKLPGYDDDSAHQTPSIIRAALAATETDHG